MIDFKTRSKLIKLKKNMDVMRLEIDNILQGKDEMLVLDDGSTKADDIVKAVCFYFNITPEQLKEYTRKREIIQRKQITIKLLKDQCGLSLNQMASILGYENHATVIHHLKEINQAVSGTVYGNKDTENHYKNVCELLGV